MAYDLAVVNPTGKHRPKRRHHGEGSRPFKVTDTRRRRPWRCDLRLGRDPVTGKLRTRSFWGTSAAEAERLRDEYRKRLRRAGSPEAAERTVAALLADWMAERRPDVDPSTARRYSAIIDQHLVPTLGHLLVTEVAPADVAAARASWTNQRKGKDDRLLFEGRPLSAASSNIALGILREAFGPLGRRGLVADPTADVKRRRKPSGAAVYLTPEQARTLLAAIEGDPLALVVRVALAVGPRRGEILGMRWPDLDLDAGTWTAGLQLRHIPTEARREGEGPYRLVEPKAGHSMGRVVSLPAFVVADLTAHKAAQRAIRRRATLWVKPGDLVFCDDIGQALPPGSVTRRFERIAKAALGMHLRFHDLRHSAATIMLAMGVPERVVQDVLGHSSGATTRGYTHVVRTLGEDAARRMDGAMTDRMAANDG